METILSARGLARTLTTRSGTVEAVRGIDMEVAAGVAGHDLARDRVGVRRRIGCVAQRGGVMPGETVRAELRCQGRLYGLGRAEAASAANSTSRSPWCTGPPSSPWTSRRPASTPTAAPTCGT